MTDTPSTSSRRTVLQLLSGTAIGAAGFASAAAASEEPAELEPVRVGGRSQWVLRLGRIDDQIGAHDTAVADLQSAAEAAQAPVVSTLETTEGVEVRSQYWLANAILVSVDDSVVDPASDLGAIAGVEDVHPNFEVEPPDPIRAKELTPLDHGMPTYGLEQIKAPDVWEQFNATGAGVTVTVLDTGVDADHPDLDVNDFAYFDNDGNIVSTDPFDDDGHGTHVSGTVSGGSESGLDIGVAPDVTLNVGKVLDPTGAFAQIIAGMEWAVDNGSDAINLSLGATGYFDQFIEPVQNATAAGTIVVSSSGNSGPDTSGSPANVYEAFAIGASDDNGDIASFSSGELITTSEDWTASWLTEDWPINYYVPDVSAPGDVVLSSYPGGQWAYLSGTSMASPHVAGAVALLLEAAGSLTVDEIKANLVASAVHGDGPNATPDARYGEGIIDALSASALAQNGAQVSGAVTDTDDNALGGASVTTDFGTDAETDGSGEYSLVTGPGQWDVTASQFGYQSATQSIDVSVAESETVDFALEDAVDIELVAGQPDVIGQDESFDIELQVANLEELTIDRGSGGVARSDITIEVGGETFTPAGTVTFDSPQSGTLTMTVTIDGDAAEDTFTLDHEFAGPHGPITAQTGPTEVMADPADASFEIVDWSEDQFIGLGGTLSTAVTVENTGDRTATQQVAWWLADPESQNVFPSTVTLAGGESTEVSLNIGIPADFAPPGTQIPHGWLTEDAIVQTILTFTGSMHVFAGLDAPDTVSYGDTFEVTATVANDGTNDTEDTVQFTVAGTVVDSATVSVPAGSTEEVTLSFDTTQVVRGVYDFALSTTWDSVSGSVRIGELQVPPGLAPYVNDNGVVDTSGLLQAIDDWRAGDISTSLLLDIIDYWRSGEPVTGEGSTQALPAD